MVQQFTGFITDDGSKFACEADAHKHEIGQAIRAKFPAMLSSVGTIMDNLEWFAALLSPMAPIPANHPQPLDKPPLAGTCLHTRTRQTGNRKICMDCSIIMPDPCPKGGNHDWQSDGALTETCTKCEEGRA